MEFSKSFRKLCVIGYLVALVGGSIQAQDFINTRKISLSLGDTTVVAGILADVEVERVNPMAYYFWFDNGTIFRNQGGYAGNLLHGEYVEYSKDGRMILKGAFDRGLQSGLWLRWYRDGNIKESQHYAYGELEGRTIRYSQDGRITFSADYKGGVLHGNMNTVISDTLFQITYKRGIEKKKEALHVFELTE